jgi:hypothetical protein
MIVPLTMAVGSHNPYPGGTLRRHRLGGGDLFLRDRPRCSAGAVPERSHEQPASHADEVRSPRCPRGDRNLPCPRSGRLPQHSAGLRLNLSLRRRSDVPFRC